MGRFLVPIFFTLLSNFAIATEKPSHRFRYSINLGITNGFVDGRSGITDYSFIFVNRPSIGAAFGGGIRYQLNDAIFLYSGITLMSLESISYIHFGTYSTSGEGFLQLPLYFSFRFPENQCKKAYFFSLGAVISHSAHEGTSFTQRGASDFLPERTASTLSRKGFYPLLHFGFGWSTTTTKGREIEYSFHFHKGFYPIDSYTIERQNPYRKSTFSYNGSLLKFQMNWYFKSKK